MHLKKQDIGFRIDRPEGTKSYIFLHFINPVDIKIDNQYVRTASNACFIYSPDVPQYYVAKTHPMYHNYIHFDPDDAESFGKFKLPLNKVFYTNMRDKIIDLVEDIEWVQNSNTNIQRMWYRLDELFDMLSKELHSSKKSGFYAEPAPFEQLRSLIYQSPKDWNVASMASFVYLSRSRFSTKYHKIFGISPVDDLSIAALQLADKLLLTTDIRIMDIAYECGFDSVQYFIRKYKAYRNMTPGEYRKKSKIQ